MDDIAEEINETMNITITCEDTGYPTPTIMWSKANGTLSDRILMGDAVPTGDDSVSVNLTITNASRDIHMFCK